MSQMPEVAGSWPEEGAQYVPGAPMEPVQQGYPPQQQYSQQQQYQQQQYQQQEQQQQYQQQGYQDQQYAQQQYQQQQQQYQQQQYQDQTAPQQSVALEEEQSSVPSEFDHLFRDSSPENRKSISGRQPVVSGPGAAAPNGFPQQQTQQAGANYAPPQQPQPFEDRAPTEYQPQSPPFGGGYGEPGGPGSGGGASGRRTPLIVGGVVAAVAAIGLYLGLSGGGGGGKGPTAGPTASTSTHASNETAQQQAAAVYQLVQQSKQLRSDINAEVGGLKSCSNVSSLQAEITNTAQARQSQANQVATLDVSKISGGAALVSALHAAWSDSAASDSDYAKAAGDFSGGGCSKSAVENDSNYQAATQGSTHVTNEKADAVTKWNGTMTNYGQPQISQSDL